MITGFLMQMGIALIGFFVGLLPIVAMPSGWTDAFTLIWGYMNAFSFLFPMATLVSVLSLALTFHLTLLGYDVSLKVYHMIRGH